jgi:replicative DNA helicase
METTILSNLVYNKEYYAKVFPFIKDEYFENNSHRKVFDTYADYVIQYKSPPSLEALKLSLEKRTDLNESLYSEVMDAVSQLKVDKDTNTQFLFNETEKFCQDKDLYNSIRKAITILNSESTDDGSTEGKGSIPKMLQDSLGISFDSSVGHDYLEEFESRYDFYHKKEERIPFDIDLLNTITKGGLPRKSMTVLLATTGGGKSLLKCHMAANHMMYGKNVLYITMEMAEERIAERIDANMMDITIDQVKEIPRDVYEKRINRYKSKTTGKLVIKEYPTGSAHSGHFRHLLNELKMKKNFTPDIVFVDYLNICSSARVRGAAAANSYTLVKSIAEEIRGLAMEFNCAVVTSSQFNRDGYGNSDVDLTNTSESMGITHTADCILGLITSEDLDDRGQLMIKQLKNRWGDLAHYRRFLVGIDRAKMKIYNLEESAQTNMMDGGNKQPKDDGPAFDKGAFGSRMGGKKTGQFKTDGLL